MTSSIVSLQDRQKQKPNKSSQHQSVNPKGATQLKKLILLKQYREARSASYYAWDLRQGLALKVHQFRQTQEEALKERLPESDPYFQEIQMQLLSMASDTADYVLYEETSSTLDLLNFYSDYKRRAEKLVTGASLTRA